MLKCPNNFSCGLLYTNRSLGVVSMSSMSRFNLASMRQWIPSWDAFLALFLLLYINTLLTFLAFSGEVALILQAGTSVIGGDGVGLCNALVLLCLVGYWCTLGGLCLLNTGSLTLISGSASTLKVGGMVMPAAPHFVCLPQ